MKAQKPMISHDTFLLIFILKIYKIQKFCSNLQIKISKIYNNRPKIKLKSPQL